MKILFTPQISQVQLVAAIGLRFHYQFKASPNMLIVHVLIYVCEEP